MKKALLPVVLTLGTLVSCNAIAETTWNYTWQGKTYIANSTGGIDNSIIQNGQELKFIAVTDKCVRGTGGGTYDDDCDRNIVRSQLQQQKLLNGNKNLKYTFSIKHDSTIGKGIRTGINIFEIKPFGAGTPTVPTFVLYFDPKTRNLKSTTSLYNHSAPGSTPVDINRVIGKLDSKWNNIQIETKQAASRYLRPI